MLVLLCNTDPKERQSETMKVIKSRSLGAGGFVDVVLIWVDSEISTMNLLTGTAILKLILNIFKEKKVVCFLIKN